MLLEKPQISKGESLSKMIAIKCPILALGEKKKNRKLKDYLHKQCEEQQQRLLMKETDENRKSSMHACLYPVTAVNSWPASEACCWGPWEHCSDAWQYPDPLPRQPAARQPAFQWYMSIGCMQQARTICDSSMPPLGLGSSTDTAGLCWPRGWGTDTLGTWAKSCRSHPSL